MTKGFMDFYTDKLGGIHKNAAAAPGGAPAGAPPGGGAPVGAPMQAPPAAMAMPEPTDQASAITCDSACKYAQNPEKRCMLAAVTYTQDEDGSFMCTQYSPAPEAIQAVQTAAQQQQQQAASLL